MTVLPRRLIRSALLVGCLGLLLPAIAIASKDVVAFKIDDKAKMFSPDAVEKANQKIEAIKRDYDEDVLVETHDELPTTAQKEYEGLSTAKEKSRFWSEFVDARYKTRHVRGIYLLILQNPGHYQFAVGETTKAKAFTAKDRTKAEEILKENLEAKTFDKGLLAVVNDIELTLKRNIPKAKSTAEVPVSTKPSTSGIPSIGIFSGIGGMICLALVVVLALWLIVGVFRALTGAGNRPVDRAPYGNQAGYGPQQGGGGGGGYAPQQQGGGGGGFMKGMLGGMLGAAGGMFLYDRFFGGGHSPMGGGMTPTAYGGTPPADNDDRVGDTGGGDYGSGGARDDAGGGGGDWGKKDDDGGGSSFGGGDDGGGGSFGGGDDGGGGSFGGGDGGGGGGGGDW
jgi:TPM domain